MPTYDAILAPLDALPNVVRRPFTAQAIADLEAGVGMSAPLGVRAWLTRVGLFQDVTDRADIDFQLLGSPDAIIGSSRAIGQILGPDGAAGLFPFGDDGAGDVVAVRPRTDGSDELVSVDHETGKISSEGRFEDWLSRVVQAAIDAPTSASDKQWCVQFSFKTVGIGAIFDAMRTIAAVEVNEDAWSAAATSPAGLRQDKLPFRLDGHPLTLSRLRYDGWITPIFSFDFQESAFVPPEQSLIAILDATFRARRDLGYTLVDYGPLDVNVSDEEDDANDAPTGLSGFLRRLGAMFRT